MSYVLKLESIGDDERAYLAWCRNQIDDVLRIDGLGQQIQGKYPGKCWVAEITGLDTKYKYRRKFLGGKKDYSEANGPGSRGVYIYYILQEGRTYEVKSPQSWKRTDRYFCTIAKGMLIRLSEQEVNELQWLKNS